MKTDPLAGERAFSGLCRRPRHTQALAESALSTKAYAGIIAPSIIKKTIPKTAIALNARPSAAKIFLRPF